MADPSETTQVARGRTDEGELTEAVRELTSQVGDLQAELESLRAERRSGLPAGDADRHGWEEGGATVLREGPAWVRTVDSPRPRGIAVPWLALEIAFLVAVAVLAAVAGLEPVAIGGVMAVAWALVALGEWFAARAERERRAVLFGGGVPVAPTPADDRAWFATNGDDTLLDAPSGERHPARLPPPE